MNRLVPCLLFALTLGACSTVPPSSESAEQDYMVVFSRPSTLNIVDLERDRLAKTCDIPGVGMPGTVIVNPEGTIAYILAERWTTIYGIRLDDCEVVFSAIQSKGNMRVVSMTSIALSPSGHELYTHQVRSLLKNDRYESLPTQVAVYPTDAGVDAPLARAYPAPRQVTIMKTGADGSLYMGGKDVYRMNVTTGEWETVLLSLNQPDPGYSPRDVLSMWPLGESSNEFIRMYTVLKWLGEPGDTDNIEPILGLERIDLATGEITESEFGTISVVLFTAAPRPGAENQIYAVLNELIVYDQNTRQEIRKTALDHAYYVINFSTDGSKFYLGGTLSDISVHDADSLQQIKVIPVSGDMGAANTYVFRRSEI